MRRVVQRDYACSQCTYENEATARACVMCDAPPPAAARDVLDQLALTLAEVRHDLSVARSLRAEEQSRVDALVARRKAILAEQVPYLVFRRPRFTLTLQDVPLIAAQPADIVDPVPACRAEMMPFDAISESMSDVLPWSTCARMHMLRTRPASS